MKINRRSFISGSAVGALVPSAFADSTPKERVAPNGPGGRTSAAWCANLADVGEFDICVAGGSCTGVFAALRAAEAGLRVAIVEMAGGFGGTCTQGLVPIWHTQWSTDGKEQIIRGLTTACIDELLARGEARWLAGLDRKSRRDALLNVAGLQILLDERVRAAKTITSFLHSRLAAVECDRPGHVTSVIIADKAGLRRLRAKFFIDATGDADLCRFAGFPVWRLAPKDLQTHTTCALLTGIKAIQKKYPKFSLGEIMKPGYGADLKHRFGWGEPVVGAPDVMFHAYTRIDTCDPSDPEALTRAEFEGRAQLRRIVDAANRAFPMPQGQRLAILSIAPHVGLRESCHIEGLYQVTGEDILSGRSYPDEIARGTYRVDIHEGGGITFKYLDGRMGGFKLGPDGQVISLEKKRWRPKTPTDPTSYAIPYRAIVPKTSENVLAPGRALDSSREAFGACRVMVNCNQMGESAGLAAVRAVKENLPAAKAYAGRGGAV